MRLLSVLVLSMIVTMITPAYAGKVTYADMRGKWESTSCKPPQALLAGEKNSETPANDLNAQVAERNKFVDEAHAYMVCISQEAQKDSDATALLVTQSAKVIIDKTQAEIDAALVVSSAQAKAAEKPAKPSKK